MLLIYCFVKTVKELEELDAPIGVVSFEQSKLIVAADG